MNATKADILRAGTALLDFTAELVVMSCTECEEAAELEGMWMGLEESLSSCSLDSLIEVPEFLIPYCWNIWH